MIISVSNIRQLTNAHTLPYRDISLRNILNNRYEFFGELSRCTVSSSDRLLQFQCLCGRNDDWKRLPPAGSDCDTRGSQNWYRFITILPTNCTSPIGYHKIPSHHSELIYFIVNLWLRRNAINSEVPESKERSGRSRKSHWDTEINSISLLAVVFILLVLNIFCLIKVVLSTFLWTALKAQCYWHYVKATRY